MSLHLFRSVCPLMPILIQRLIYNGERVFSLSGEFHPFSLPVPEMWVDVMEKIKAIGMNTVSFYSHWGFYASTNVTLDFETGAHDIGRIYGIAKEINLFVHARPGPYINAETNAGGMPLWVTTGEYGGLRDNTTAFTNAWRPYMNRGEEITAPYQVTHNGTVISYQTENEFPNKWTDVEEKIPNPVPIEYMKSLFEHSQSNGLVVPLTHNMPGQEYKSWPVDYDTVGAGGNVHIYGLDNYVSPKQPSMMREFQGGALNPWDGPAGGCEEKTDESFVNFYYRDNVAQRVTIIGLYMIHGGTNWGWLAAPFVSSSYGYGAAIAENRTIGSKYYEIKSLALLTRVAKDLTKSDIIGNSTSYSDNEAVTTIELRNPDTDAGFYAIRHTDLASDDEQFLRLSIRTSAGNFTVPTVAGNDRMALNGHVSKILVTDFDFGGKRLQVGITVIVLSNGVRILLMDRDTAHLFWVPALTDDPTVPVDQVAFVQGPRLVRAAQLEHGIISLRGDSNETTRIEVFTTDQVRTIAWNGKKLKTEKTSWGSLTAEIDGPEAFELSQLGTWRMQDSLTERPTNHSDSGPVWVNANDTETPRKYKVSTKPYLYSGQYGFHTGVHLWRGYFNGPADGVYLEVQGGIAHGWSAWLNGKLIGSFLGNLISSVGSDEFSFPEGSVRDGQNVLLVMQDNTGHDQGSASLNVAGTAGGASNALLDPVRTRYNEGGLRAERLGWHLPGFDDSGWPQGFPGDGFEGAGARFYRTNFRLDTPIGHGVALSVKLDFDSEETSKSFRAYPYVNEAMNIFPAPPGVWNYDGDNVIGLAIWNQEETEMKCDLGVKVDYVLASSSLDAKFDGAYLRPGWDDKRFLYG
ncbi:glycosyl hydrolases family 35-domain-containing protein [Aspergillus aurantiobrunneus]